MWGRGHFSSSFSSFFFFFFGRSCGMWKFPGQGWHACHSNKPSRCNDNTRSLTCYATREFLLLLLFFFFFFFFFGFLGLHLWNMEAPRLGVKSELRLPAYATATSTWETKSICNLHHSSGQCWILNPLSKDRDRIHILMDTSRVLYHWATTGTPICTS